MKEILKRHSFSATFLLLFVGAVFLYGGDDAGIQQLNGYTMGTTYQVQIVDMPREQEAPQLASDINALLTRLDTDIFSTYATNSELSRFNRHPIDTDFIASAQLIEVLMMAQEVADLSEGAFDVTVGPLVNLWGFGPDLAVFETVPAPDEIESARENVGSRYLRIDASRQTISKTRDIYVDLSAIAKGYAVDELASYLDSRGVQSYFLEIGGELKMRGSKPDGSGWVPAIEAPLDTESQVYQIFYSRGDNIAVAGSGDYRNYFEEEGQRYSHEIDPRSGRPVTHRLAAAYVIDESAAMADALATTYMVLGPASAEALAARQQQAVYFIYKSEGSGFEDYISEPFRRYLNSDLN